MIDPVTRRLFRDAGQHGPLVLMYHSVQAGVRRAGWRWAISQRGFGDHLDLLRDNGWTTHRFSALGEDAAMPKRSVLITFDDGYADNMLAAEELSRRGMQATFFVVSRDIGRRSCWHEAEIAPQPMLAEPDIRDMHAAGMEVGSHSRRHVLLPGLPPSELQDEVQRSRSDIEQVIGAAVTGFSYPYGRYDDAAVAAVRDAGYSAACSTRPGVHRPGESLTVRRLSIHNDDTPARLARKLAFADNRCEWPFVARYYGSRLARRLGLPGNPPGSGQ